MASRKDTYWATMRHLEERKRSYQLVFSQTNLAAQAVLKDLARVCRANQTCFDPDPRTHAFNEGKRAMWLRIQQHLNLPETVLYDLYGGIPVQLVSEEENDA